MTVAADDTYMIRVYDVGNRNFDYLKVIENFDLLLLVVDGLNVIRNYDIGVDIRFF